MLLSKLTGTAQQGCFMAANARNGATMHGMSAWYYANADRMVESPMQAILGAVGLLSGCPLHKAVGPTVLGLSSNGTHCTICFFFESNESSVAPKRDKTTGDLESEKRESA